MDIKDILFSPPMIFFLFTAVTAVLAAVLSKYAAKGKTTKRGLDAYACGQRGFKEYVNPDYTQFFTFAFIFTVMHVLTMVVATAPKDMSLLPIIYIFAGVLVLIIVFRRDD